MLMPIVVIGGGAAGLMAAGRAAEKGGNVVLLEKNSNLARKILISGKGRCNVTNSAEIQEIINNFPGNGRFLYSALHRFSNEDLVRFFEKRGVKLKTERGGRIFPVSDSSQDIVNALRTYCQSNGVDICLNQKVVEILTRDNQISGVKIDDGRVITTNKIIICTGGCSYPGTGSTGDGFIWAEKLSHKVNELLPALVPLVSNEPWIKNLQGLALKNVNAAIFAGEKKLREEFGEMLFTHFGVSGPIILTLSRDVVSLLKKNQNSRPVLTIDLKPALTEEQLDNRIQRDFHKFQRKQLKNSLNELLPQKLIPIIIELSSIDENKFVHQITKSERLELIKTIKSLRLNISGTRSISEAIVTSGGVDIREINPKTMESKLISGLYFAGEIIDIDAKTGGYNLQAAFSTGYLAGEEATLVQYQ